MRLLLLTILTATLFTACNEPAATTTSPTKQDEREHPGNYLKVNYEVHKNLLGKKIIDGTVIHTGKYLTYKTVTLRIDCIKDGNNNTVSYTVPDAVKPGGQQSFRFKAGRQSG